MNRELLHSPRLLLADDDEELAGMLADYLRDEGFTVSMVHEGITALELARDGAFDLMVLDIMMPGMNGLDVLRELRRVSALPVLMLTARGEDIDSILGLELGADDYLAKPTHARVLVARIRAILRRARGHEVTNEENDIHLADVTISPTSRTVLLNLQPVEMTSTEFSVLLVLAGQAGHVVTRAALCEQALGRPLDRFDRSIDMHVSSVRKKLGSLAGGLERIKTIRGVGYQYVL